MGSDLFADMLNLPTPAPSETKAEQLIDAGYHSSTVLRFLELVSVHHFEPLLPADSFWTCRFLLEVAERFDCVRLMKPIRKRLHELATREKRAWALFILGAERDDWPMGRQALRSLSSRESSPFLGPSSRLLRFLKQLPVEWQLVLASQVLNSSCRQYELLTDWSTIACKFVRPDSSVDADLAR
jgi:hypothetical protein